MWLHLLCVLVLQISSLLLACACAMPLFGYWAESLVAQGDHVASGAIDALRRLTQVRPGTVRMHQRW